MVFVSLPYPEKNYYVIVTVEEPFKQKFHGTIPAKNLDPEQIYNADKSSLFWKLLSEKIFVHKKKKSTSSWSNI